MPSRQFFVGRLNYECTCTAVHVLRLGRVTFWCAHRASRVRNRKNIVAIEATRSRPNKECCGVCALPLLLHDNVQLADSARYHAKAQLRSISGVSLWRTDVRRKRERGERLHTHLQTHEKRSTPSRKTACCGHHPILCSSAPPPARPTNLCPLLPRIYKQSALKISGKVGLHLFSEACPHVARSELL